LSNTYAAELSDDTRNSATAKENCGLVRDLHIIGMEQPIEKIVLWPSLPWAAWWRRAFIPTPFTKIKHEHARHTLVVFLDEDDASELACCDYCRWVFDKKPSRQKTHFPA
jgi:hypothetical protein